MRLLAFAQNDHVRIGVLVGEVSVQPLPATAGRLSSMQGIIKDYDDLRPALEDYSEIKGPDARPLSAVKLLPPIADPGKIVAIGLNYSDHAAEAKLPVPAEPTVFAKFPSSIIGPGDPIRWRRSLTDAVDAEAELALIIARRARNVLPAEALNYVFGYTCLNDVSARDLQFRDGQWVRAKSLDTFCPIGPWIVTADEIPDPQSLEIKSTVSGAVLQSSSTANMLFPVAELISRLSMAFTLEPGDIVATGTPAGVGWFREPRRLLRQGDEVVVEIEGIGALRNTVLVDE